MSTAQSAKPKPVKEKIVVVAGKKKKALARARIKHGKGSIRINSVPLSQWGNFYERSIVAEPFLAVQENIKDLDIDVWTKGGGVVGQAHAARVAIARGICEFTKSQDIRKALISYDDKILSGDARQREPNKPNRSAPRAVRQKSYR